MTAAPALEPTLKARLRARAEALSIATDCWAMTEFGLVWSVSRRVIRAYVWATHRGVDPLPAIAKAKFGAIALGPIGVATVQAYAARLAAIEARP